MNRKDAFEQANAFVDGELDRDGRSETLARAAGDPRAVQELADLARLKSAVEDSVDVPELSLPEAGLRRATGGRRRLIPALAACLLLAIVSGAAMLWNGADAPANGLPVAWAVEAHESWHAAPPGTPLLRPASLKFDPHVPDLSAAKLRIAHIGEIRAPGGAPALVVGYKGTRGCRVSLIADAAPKGFAIAPVFYETAALKAMVWRAGTLRYQILARGMATARFRQIAETVRRGSLDRLPLDDATRMALARSRAKSTPCAA